MTDKEINEFNYLLNTFNDIAERGINDISEKWVLSMLEYSLPLIAHMVVHFKFETLERVTINNRVIEKNKRIKNIKFLKYPPAENVTKYGRCNLPKQSVFYGSTMFMTAMNEMQPRVGDLITKSIWKLKEEHTLKLCPIFYRQPTNGTHNPNSYRLEKDFLKLVKNNFLENLQEVVINLSKFIAYHFSKFVHHKKNKDYIFSAYFANEILNEFDNGSIEGIMYPSIKSHLSFENIAIKTDIFDKYYELSEVYESVVIKDPSDGGKGYGMSGINDCKKFDFKNDIILWNNNIHQPKNRMDFYKKHFDLDIE